MAWNGENLSFINNFTASAKGWSKPDQETLLGPLRDWLSPKIFRSNKVTKATFTRTGTITIKNLTRLIKIILEVIPPQLQCDALFKLQEFIKIIIFKKFRNSIFIVVITSVRLLAITALIHITEANASIYLNLEIRCWSAVNLNFPILIDSYRIRFLFTVSFIARSIYIFSWGYIAQEPFFLRFHLLVLSFVLSIFLLIISPHLVRVLIGWDGLGVTSYLLVVYFQSRKSYNAGIVTALTNRLGDVLILLALAIIACLESWNFSLLNESQLEFPWFMIATLVLASCTKRAQIPFSAWLPAAIAAPTPVSSLVHSSTLVTAGVYLIVRFCPWLLLSKLQLWLLWAGMATMLLAGMAAMMENDIKKIIALSTLSQLGVIITSLGAGFFNAAFFHLLAHAFFKALLFVTVGRIIHIALDFQDLRKASLSLQRRTLSLSVNLGANFSLCGLPFTRGFFSKDLCLELFFSRQRNFWLTSLFILATALTAAYTVRFIFNLSLIYSKLTVWSNIRNLDPFIRVAIILIFPFSLMSGRFLRWVLFSVPSSPILSISFKNLTFLVVLLGSIVAISILIKKLLTIFAPLSMCLNMWGLPLITTRVWASGILKERWKFRSLMDFAWTPALTNHLAYSQIRIKYIQPSSRNIIFFMGGIAWVRLLILLYLCVINFFIFHEIKIQIYTYK